MRLVLPVLAPEVAPIAIGVAIFPLETLLTRPRLEQRAVDGEVFVRHQIGRTRDHALKEAVGHGVLQQPIAILREDRRHPDRFIHLQAHEPPKQDVVIELLHQQPLTPNRVEQLQQLRPHEALGRNRRPAVLRVERIKLARHLPQDLIDKRANGAERVILGHALLGRHIAEHRTRLTIVSSHGRHGST
jgi:hypothetical protein